MSGIKKKITAFMLIIASVLCLPGCGSIFEKEYVYIADYTPPAQTESYEGSRFNAGNLSSLKKTLIGFVENGETEGTVIFEGDYEGDPSADLQQAVWEIRTGNALCAYCVESVTYELSKIISYYEAVVHISYSESCPVSEIVSMSYAVGVDKLIQSALSENRDKLVLYINYSTLSAEKIKSTVSQVYRSSPLICAAEPNTTVNTYGGSANQRLYEISFSYGISEADIIRRKAQVIEPDYLNEMDLESMSTYERLLAGCSYLVENCSYDPDTNHNTAYDALVDFSADSKGLALAYVELCNRMGCNCIVVEGMKDRIKHYWNIVKVDGDYYHVDISACIQQGMLSGFLLNDEKLWGSYRWDLSSVSKCEGPDLYLPEEPGTDSPPEGQGEEPEAENFPENEEPSEEESPEDTEPETDPEESAVSGSDNI